MHLFSCLLEPRMALYWSALWWFGGSEDHMGSGSAPGTLEKELTRPQG